jgi:hypothetical protein
VCPLITLKGSLKEYEWNKGVGKEFITPKKKTRREIKTEGLRVQCQKVNLM